jgi:energy-converting hydrogenase A subunit M
MAEEKAKERDMIKEYDALRKKYNLPELKELDKEFCIGKLEESDFLLRTVLMKMAERLEIIVKSTADIIQPESSLSSMYESEALSDDDKKKVFELLKKSSYWQKELLIRELEYSDEAAAEAINKAHKEWLVLKKEFILLLAKIKESWKSERKTKLESGYFG